MDITKCDNKECPVKDNCLRWIAKDNEHWQSYSHFECNEDNNYEHKLRVNTIR